MSRLSLVALLAGAAFIIGAIASSPPAGMTGSSSRFVCFQEQSGNVAGSSLRAVCNGNAEATQESATRMSFFQRLVARAKPQYGGQ